MNTVIRRGLTTVATAVVMIAATGVVGGAAAHAASDNYTGPIYNYNSDQVMAVQDASTANNAPAIQYPYSATAPNNDEMYLEWQGGSNWFRIKPLHSNKCLAVQNASLANNAGISQAPCTYDSLNNDVWLVEGTLHNSGSVPWISYQFRNLLSGKCIVVSGASQVSGARLVQFTCETAGPSGVWYF